VLTSPRFRVAAKLRIINSVIWPVLEYGMEVWGPPQLPVTGKRKRGELHPPLPLEHFDQLLVSACRLACGIRGLPGEPGWTRRACVSPEVLLAVCQVLPSERACDLAHLRYSERLRAATRRPCDSTTLFFRAAARDALPPSHPWLQRLQRSSQDLPAPLPPAALSNHSLRAHVRSQASSAWETALGPYPASDNVSARGRRRGPGPPAHINPLRHSLAICSAPLRLLQCDAAVVYPFLCVLSGNLPFCHSVHWDSLPLHGHCPRPNCEVCIAAPPPDTAGGYTLLERRWRCTQHFLFSCKASPLGCPDPNDLWRDILDLLPPAAMARSHLLLAQHVDSFDADAVCTHCMPWVLDPSCFLQDCPLAVCAHVHSLVAAYVLLVGASVADATVPVGQHEFASGLVHRSLLPLALPPASRVAGHCPPPFRPSGGAEAEAPAGYGVVPD
jgi:hypothetical protein